MRHNISISNLTKSLAHNKLIQYIVQIMSNPEIHNKQFMYFYNLVLLIKRKEKNSFYHHQL